MTKKIRTVSDLLRTHHDFRKTLRWSQSKQATLDRIDKALGRRALSTLDKKALIEWAMSYRGSILTVEMMLATLSGVMHLCEDVLDLNLPHPEAPSRAHRVLKRLKAIPPKKTATARIDDAVIEKIIEQWASTIDPRFLWVLMHTAMRSGELCRITWEDVDWNERTVIIRDRKHPSEKWGNHQTIPLLGGTDEILLSRRNAIGADSGRICPYKQETLSAAFRAASRKAGYSIRLHDLRHEGISRLFDRGWTIPQVAAVSGHRDWRVLTRYTHIKPSELLKAQSAWVAAA